MQIRSLFIVIIILSLFSCASDKKNNAITEIEDFSSWHNVAYKLSPQEIRRHLDTIALHTNNNMYCDKYVSSYYSKPYKFLWITRTGLSCKADTLLNYLEKATNDGLPINIFKSKQLKEIIANIKSLDYNTSEKNINKIYGNAEYLLTHAYIRYACGEHFGYIQPDSVFNQLQKSEGKFTTLYDIRPEKVDSAFISNAFLQLENNQITSYLNRIQNNSELYKRLSFSYNDTTDTIIKEKIIVNRERCRWKTQDLGNKFVFVNLAAMQLYAINKGIDSISMKVCCGSTKHKSPQLISNIERIEMNPYWNIPFNIIKREIAPLHAQDTSYFKRNRYRILEKGTGKEVSAKDITKGMLSSGDYHIRQDNGAGNALGRLVFRFPNRFSVYLHDTNNKSAFSRDRRTVSHGCIRVEEPLDLAIFLLDEPNEKEINEIRVAIGLPPLIEKGTTDSKENSKNKLKIKNVEPKVPVSITYYTLYPNLQNELESHPDVYGYDKVIIDKLLSY